jgi:hypothetical protein
LLRKYAMAGISNIPPYKTVGIEARKFSAIQAVAAGMRESQNNK